MLIQHDLALCLDRIAERGADEFYTGRTAALIARYMSEKGGFVTLDDLKSYRAKLRPPVHTTFRGSEVYSIGPPSSGGIVLCQMLNILERFDLRKDGRGSPATLHRVTEAMRAALFSRGPTSSATPTSSRFGRRIDLKGLLGPARLLDRRLCHAEPRSCTFSDHECRSKPHHAPISHRPDGQRRRADIHARRLLGSEVRGLERGFLLNNEMGDFKSYLGKPTPRGESGRRPT